MPRRINQTKHDTFNVSHRLEDYTPCEGRLNPSRLEDYAAPHRACHASESLTNEHVIA